MDSELQSGAACAKTRDFINFGVKNCVQQSFLCRAELYRALAGLGEEARLFELPGVELNREGHGICVLFSSNFDLIVLNRVCKVCFQQEFCCKRTASS